MKQVKPKAVGTQYPRGTCYCGCGKDTGRKSLFQMYDCSPQGTAWHIYNPVVTSEPSVCKHCGLKVLRCDIRDGDGFVYFVIGDDLQACLAFRDVVEVMKK